MKEYLFLHIPKCAGSSVHALLPDRRWNNFTIHRRSQFTLNQDSFAYENGYESKPHHYSLEQHTKINVCSPEDFNSAYKFSFVRNPFDRMVSTYHYSLDTSDEWKGISFEDFLSRAERIIRNESLYRKHGPIQPNHLVPQCKYIYAPSGEKIVDFCGRVENFDSDIRHVFEQIGLPAPEIIPRSNITPGRKSYKEYYNEESIRLVEDLYEADLGYFNYAY